MRCRIGLGLAITICLMIGCASTRVQKGQRDMRRTLLTLQEEQILDNLVRLERGLPIVHLDYNKLYAEMTDTFGATTGGIAYNDTDTALRHVPGAAQPATSSLVGAGSHATNLTAGTSGTAVTKLTLTADPVIGKSSVYGAYLAYNDPDRAEGFRERNGVAPLEGPVSCAPPDGSYILRKRYNDGWYFIPTMYRKEFRALGLVVGGLARKSELQTPTLRSRFLAAKRLTPPADATWPTTAVHTYAVRLDAPIPKDTGDLIASLELLGGEKVVLGVIPATKASMANGSFTELAADPNVFGKRWDAYPDDEPMVNVILLRIPHRILPVDSVSEAADGTVTVLRVDSMLVIEELLKSPKGHALRLHNAPDVAPSPENELLEKISRTLDQQLLRNTR